MKAIKDLFTGIDGVTHDPARYLWILGCLSFLGFAAWEVYSSGKFDMTSFGIAYAGLLAGGAAGVKIKETSEPVAKAVIQPVAAQKDPEQ